MTRMIFCKRLNKEAPGLDVPPYPGAIGDRIFEQISQEAWLQWIEQQTMLINEYRLNLTDKKSREFLETEMDKFFFGEGSERPQGFIPADEA